MKLESHLPRQSPWLFAAPLMTAMMLLIICYLFSSGFAGKSGINIVPPESTSRLTGFDRAHIITIPAGTDATLYFDGTPVTLAELKEQLKAKRDGERRVIIYHDRSAPGGRLIEVTNLAHHQGYAVAIATVSPQQ
jgi:biopolymer transport protein ExbD